MTISVQEPRLAEPDPTTPPPLVGVPGQRESGAQTRGRLSLDLKRGVISARVDGLLDEIVGHRLLDACEQARQTGAVHVLLDLTGTTGFTPAGGELLVRCLQVLDALPGGYTVDTSSPAYDDELTAILQYLNAAGHAAEGAA